MLLPFYVRDVVIFKTLYYSNDQYGNAFFFEARAQFVSLICILDCHPKPHIIALSFTVIGANCYGSLQLNEAVRLIC